MSPMSLFRMRMTLIIAMIAAHTHAIAIMAFMNAFPPPIAGLASAGPTMLQINAAGTRH
ncbi:MAG TPA: hypothetical protein VMA73_01140 [Streptosporangiaceae bacterium]|nr:hypothetical protein [Streptosporangiaceae bacterium]